MKRSTPLKAFALALAIGTFSVAGNANAYDDPEPGEVVLGIIGEVLSGAIDSREARRRDREFDRYCRRLDRRCNRGNWRACRRYDRHCGY